MPRLMLTLVMLLAALNVAHADESSDEPGFAQPPVAAPLPTSQIVDIDEPPARAVLVRPAVAPVLYAAAQQPTRPRLGRRGPFWTLDAGAGYAGYVAMFSQQVHGPVFTGALTMTFGRSWVKHGLRLGGFIGLMDGDLTNGSENERLGDTRMMGLNLAYVVQLAGFWLSAGWGIINTRNMMQHMVYDTADGPVTEDEVDRLTLPEGILALGYDVRLGKHLGLRLTGEMGTLLVTWRAHAVASLVVRF